MPTEVPLRCRCGALRGVATDLAPATGFHVACYCDDCQAYARFLGSEGIVDAQGGTGIFQMTPSQVRITEGEDHLRCIRLGPQGLMRWYAGCCRTPVANTVHLAGVPFCGLVQPIMDHAADGRPRDAVLGPVIVRVFGGYAIGGPPEGSHPKGPLWYIARVAAYLAKARIAGKQKPSPFFDATTGKPTVKPEVLTKAERDALRPAR